MYVEVEKVENADLLKPLNDKNDEHTVVKNTITGAIRQQMLRFGENGKYNSALSSFEVSRLFKMEPVAEKLLAEASEKLALSARSYFKTIKVAQTIADLEAAPIIKPKHLAEALTYRKR